MSDRLAGLTLLVISVAYVWLAAGYTTSFGDPLGPALFPRVVGIPAILLSLLLFLWPGHKAQWAGSAGLLRQAAAVALLIGYAVLLEPLGFVPASFLSILGLGLLMGAPGLPALITAAIAAPGLYLLFDRVMGLPLPLVGPWLH